MRPAAHSPPSLDRERVIGSGSIVVAAVGFGMLSSLARLAADAGLPTLGFITWRSGLGAVVVLAAFPMLLARSGARAPRLGDVPGGERAALLVASFAAMMINLTLFTAFARTTVAIALITFYTFPAIVTLAAVRLDHEPLDRRRGGALLLASLGLALVVLGPMIGATDVRLDALGIALALTASVFQAIFTLITSRGFPSVPTVLSSGLIMAFAGGCYVIVAGLTGALDDVLQPLRHADLWPWVLFTAIVAAAIPTIGLVSGIRRIGAPRAAILMTLEPVVGVGLAAILLAERPAPLQLVGGVMVIVAGVALQLPASMREAPAPVV